MKKSRIILPVLLLMLSPLTGLNAQNSPTVLATNAWTAAFVRMAGGQADLLAPADMVHPPEYELKTSDVIKIRDADFLVFAGYEVLMKTVFESFKKPEDQMIQITTSYDPGILEQSVMAIAEKTGTVSTARRNIEKYRELISHAQDQLKEAGLYGRNVLVNFYQLPLARALGFNILGVFGPQPLKPGDISKLARLSPDLILDNIHNPMAAPLEEILGKKAILLINFPGFPLGKGLSAPDDLSGIVGCNLKEILNSDK